MNQSHWDTLPAHYPITSKGIYLKNASISANHAKVIKAMNEATTTMGEAGICDEQAFRNRYIKSHESLAGFLDVPLANVALTSSTSYNMNIFAMMLRGDTEQNIVTQSDEFPSTVIPFYHQGFKIKKLDTHKGAFNPLDLLDLIDDKTSAVVLSTIVSTTGFRLELTELSKELHTRGIPLILNATQSLGFFDFDLNELKVAAMSASTHKSVGSFVGMAIAYMSDEFKKVGRYPLMGWSSVADPAALSIEAQEPRIDSAAIELGSMPFSLMAALDAAIEIHQSFKLDQKSAHLIRLTKKLRQGLKELNIDVLGSDIETHLSSITTFHVPEALELKEQLQERNIFVDLRRGHIRTSVGLYTSSEDVEEFLKALKVLTQ